jgi:predicted small secreted protein
MDAVLRLRTLVLVVVLGASGLALAACHTMEGVGEDMQSAGRNLEKEAQDANE